MLSGRSGPFFCGCQSAAIVGNFVANEFSLVTLLFLQKGQPDCRAVRLRMMAGHSCEESLGQSHQTFFDELPGTSFGVSCPFFEGCHCPATIGNALARLRGEELFSFAWQVGHLLFSRALVEIRASHSCPIWHFHHAFFRIPCDTSIGRRGLLRVGCHSAASCGCVTTSELSAILHFGQGRLSNTRL